MNHSIFSSTLLLLASLLAAGCELLPGTVEGSRRASAPSGERITVIDNDAAREAKRGRLQADGGMAPEAVGYYLDVQTARLQALAREGVRVERLPDKVVVVIPGGESFATDSSTLTVPARARLSALAAVLTEFEQSLVVVGGHSDSQGDSDYNLRLSQQRAVAVARFLATNGVRRGHLLARGFGDRLPVADNATEAGRTSNRRIELTLWPLIKAGRG